MASTFADCENWFQNQLDNVVWLVGIVVYCEPWKDIRGLHGGNYDALNCGLYECVLQACVESHIGLCKWLRVPIVTNLFVFTRIVAIYQG